MSTLAPSDRGCLCLCVSVSFCSSVIRRAWSGRRRRRRLVSGRQSCSASPIPLMLYPFLSPPFRGLTPPAAAAPTATPTLAPAASLSSPTHPVSPTALAPPTLARHTNTCKHIPAHLDTHAARHDAQILYLIVYYFGVIKSTRMFARIDHSLYDFSAWNSYFF